MERTGIAILLLGIACIAVAGWAWAAAIGDSQEELETDIESLKRRNER